MRLNGVCGALILSATGFVAAAPKEKPLEFHVRAYECEPMEFAELNSMKKLELESAFCSAGQGWKDAHNDSEALKNDGSSAQIQILMTQRYLKKMKTCVDFQGKSGDLLSRKFGGRPDCNRLPSLPDAEPK